MADPKVFMDAAKQDSIQGYQNRKDISGSFDQKILIVGASQGLGYELAKSLGNKNVTTIITARSQSKIDDIVKELKEIIPNGKFDGIALDLASNDSIDSVIKHIGQQYGTLDAINLNAGVASYTQDEESFKNIMATNVYGTFYFAEKSVPILKEGGKIVITSSKMGLNVMQAQEYIDLIDKIQSIHDPFFKKVPFITDEHKMALFYCTSKKIEQKYAELAAKDPLYTSKKISISSNCPGWNKTNLNGYQEDAPLYPNQGAKSIEWQLLTTDNINGGFYSFGEKFAPDFNFMSAYVK